MRRNTIETIQFKSAKQYSTHLINIDATTIETKHAAMEGAVEKFGEAALYPHKPFGGINTQAFKAGSKAVSQNAEAKRLGLTLEEATALVETIRLVNENRKTLWQDYQCAYFGRDVIKPKAEPVVKSAEEIERLAELAAITTKRQEIADVKKVVAANLKVAKAEQTIAQVNGGDTSEIDAEVTELSETRDACTRKSKELKAEQDSLTRGKRIESALDMAQTLATKLNAIEGDVGAFDLDALIIKLQNL